MEPVRLRAATTSAPHLPRAVTTLLCLLAQLGMKARSLLSRKQRCSKVGSRTSPGDVRPGKRCAHSHDNAIERHPQ